MKPEKLNSAMERYYFKTRGQEPDVECLKDVCSKIQEQ
jgi:hypothetical protein